MSPWSFTNSLIHDNEHWWLLIILLYSAGKERRVAYLAEKEYEMAVKEFDYDKAWNDKMLAREERNKARKKERIASLEKEMD